MNMCIHRSGNVADFFGQFLRPTAVLPAHVIAPLTKTSIGAESPKFRIWLTMSAGWKKNSTPGNRFGSSSRSFAM